MLQLLRTLASKGDTGSSVGSTGTYGAAEDEGYSAGDDPELRKNPLLYQALSQVRQSYPGLKPILLLLGRIAVTIQDPRLPLLVAFLTILPPLAQSAVFVRSIRQPGDCLESATCVCRMPAERALARRACHQPAAVSTQVVFICVTDHNRLSSCG